MVFSSTEIVAIIVAVGAVVVNIIVALRTGGKIESISQVTAKSLVETGVLQGQVQQVHTLTNSNLSEVKADLKRSAAEIVSLKEAILDLKSERDKTAIAAAFNTPIAAPQRPSRATDVLIGEANPLPVKVIAEEPIPVAVQEVEPHLAPTPTPEPEPKPKHKALR